MIINIVILPFKDNDPYHWHCQGNSDKKTPSQAGYAIGEIDGKDNQMIINIIILSFKDNDNDKKTPSQARNAIGEIDGEDNRLHALDRHWLPHLKGLSSW